MPDIFKIPTLAGPAYVQAKTGTAATGYARRGIKAIKLTGVEARNLPADTVIHDADAEPANDSAGGERA